MGCPGREDPEHGQVEGGAPRMPLARGHRKQRQQAQGRELGLGSVVGKRWCGGRGGVAPPKSSAGTVLLVKARRSPEIGRASVPTKGRGPNNDETEEKMGEFEF